MDNRDTHDIWNGEAGRDWSQNHAALDLFFRDARARLRGLLPLAPGARVLGIGSGAGTFGLELAQAVGPQGQVLGLDVSDPLLALARRRAEGQGSLAFRKHDIQTEPLHDPAFDACTAHIGMMFFSDPVQALTRIRAALAPGGVIAFNGWGIGHNPWFSAPLSVAERHLVPLPAAPAGDNPPPGPLAFSDVTYVTGLLTRSGYTMVEGWQENIAIRHPDGLEALMQSISYVGPISTLYRLRSPGSDLQSQIAREVRAEFARYVLPDGSVSLPAPMTFYRAVAP